jgi:hypothetical protein
MVLFFSFDNFFWFFFCLYLFWCPVIARLGWGWVYSSLTWLSLVTLDEWTWGDRGRSSGYWELMEVKDNRHLDGQLDNKPSFISIREFGCENLRPFSGCIHVLWYKPNHLSTSVYSLIKSVQLWYRRIWLVLFSFLFSLFSFFFWLALLSFLFSTDSRNIDNIGKKFGRKQNKTREREREWGEREVPTIGLRVAWFWLE